MTAIWHPFTQHALMPEQVPIERTEGAYLYTADGRRIIDSCILHLIEDLIVPIAAGARRLDMKRGERRLPWSIRRFLDPDANSPTQHGHSMMRANPSQWNVDNWVRQLTLSAILIAALALGALAIALYVPRAHAQANAWCTYPTGERTLQ